MRRSSESATSKTLWAVPLPYGRSAPRRPSIGPFKLKSPRADSRLFLRHAYNFSSGQSKTAESYRATQVYPMPWAGDVALPHSPKPRTCDQSVTMSTLSIRAFLGRSSTVVLLSSTRVQPRSHVTAYPGGDGLVHKSTRALSRSCAIHGRRFHAQPNI